MRVLLAVECPHKVLQVSSFSDDDLTCVSLIIVNFHLVISSPKPMKYVERSRAGAQMLCSSFSPGQW